MKIRIIMGTLVALKGTACFIHVVLSVKFAYKTPVLFGGRRGTKTAFLDFISIGFY